MPSRPLPGSGPIRRDFASGALLGGVVAVLLAAPVLATAWELTAHWTPPLRAGAPRDALSPRSCGECHPAQLESWSTSRHAHAFSPGLLGQLLEFSSCAEARDCVKCHTPLAEQQTPWSGECITPAAAWGDKRQPWLAESGVSCGGCHLRSGGVIGPAAPGGKPATPPTHHTGLRRVEWLSGSEFCGFCHQFPAELAVNGKPLQNTLAEWQSSPFPARGVTCQKCHLPEGRHEFRGIHDPAMVESGLQVTVESDALGATYKVRSVAIGHLFPTYTVPRVILEGRVFAADGRELSGGYREQVIARQIAAEEDRVRELSDTRLLPGAEVGLRVEWRVGEVTGERIGFRMVVEPDHHYLTQVFGPLLEELAPGPSRDLIQRARNEATSNRYQLLERELTRTP